MQVYTGADKASSLVTLFAADIVVTDLSMGDMFQQRCAHQMKEHT